MVREATENVAASVDELNSENVDRKNQKVLKWLLTDNHGARQSNLLKERIESTGQWFLDSSEFQVSLKLLVETFS